MSKLSAIGGKTAALLLLASLAFFLLATAGSDLLRFQRVKKVRHAGINFDSRSPDKALAARKELGGEEVPDLFDLALSFKMKVHSFGQYDNVFQTAPHGSGMRLELSKPLTASLVWGCNKDGGVCGVGLHPAVETGKWHSVSIVLDKHKRLKVLFNGNTVYCEKNRELSAAISDIAVGTGYSKTRDFDGAVKDLTLQYALYEERWGVAAILPFLRLLSGALFAACLVLWAARRRAAVAAPRLEWLDFLHPALVAAFPVLFLFSVNLHEASLRDVALPLFASLSAAAALVLAGYFFLRDSAKAAVLATVLLAGFFSAGRLFFFLSESGAGIAASDYCAAAGLVLSLLAGAVFFSARDYGKATAFLNRFSGILVGISLFAIGGDLVRKSLFYTSAGGGAEASLTAAAGPDIYYIILDAYASQAVLKDYFSYDNSGFAAYLAKKKFYVPSKSRSNYRATRLSIPSTLNMRYLDGLGLAAIPDLFNRNAVARFLKGKGYKFISLNLHGVLSPFNDYADLNVSHSSFSPFWVLLLKTTLLFDVADNLDDIDRNKTLAFFERLPQLVPLPGPKFVYAYVASPHQPYLFGADGGRVDKAMRDNILIGAKNAIANKKSYVGQLSFVTARIRESIDGILAASEREPVIILQSDHGPALYDTPEMAKGAIPGQDYLQARFQILNAYHLPGEGGKGLYDSITPVNSFRLVLNHYFQAGLPLLPDKSYYSPDTDPFSFTDVTGKLN